MTWSNSERLYELLPTVYQVRDGEQGEALRALLSIIQSELETLEADVEGLYDNWFIETSAEWLVPYIGDLLGVRNLHTVDSAGIYSLRAYVANTLAYRQRKGTAAVLEDLARDVTNWPARVVEFFQLLATTQHMNHIRPQNARTPDMRDANRLELLDSPFDTIAHTGEVRRIDTRLGRYNIPNVGLFLWRLQPYPLAQGMPLEILSGRYTFNPLGLSLPLFTYPKGETAISNIAAEINVPTPIRRRAAFKNKLVFLEGAPPSVTIFFDDKPLPPDEIVFCNLQEWDDPNWSAPEPDAGNEKVAIDPELGRLALLKNVGAPGILEASYTYAFSGDVGGGPYNRRDSFKGDSGEADAVGPVTWQAVVNQTDPADGVSAFNSLTDAITAWNGQGAGDVGMIVISDSHTYDEDLTGGDRIQIKPGSRLTIIAGQWSGDALGQVNAEGVRPHLQGNLTVEGLPSGADQKPGSLHLNGLLIEGVVRVASGDMGGLEIAHCTIVPRIDALLAPSASNRQLAVTVDHSICGSIRLSETISRLAIRDSIVDGSGSADPATDIEAPGADVHIERSTILGDDDTENTMRTLHASESIFTGRLFVERRQTGCVRFSHVTSDSRVPRRYYCQPALALEGVTDPRARRAIEIRLAPMFTSRIYGDPAYCQLSQACADEIRTGAEDGSEMGVFCHLKQPQREANLRAALDEYLRFGLSAGIFYVT